LTFLLDNMISPRIAAALKALGEDVRALRDEFPPETSDTQWVESIGKKGWSFITADKRISTRPHQVAALQASKVTGFFLGRFWAKTKFWDQAVWLIRHWPKFKDMASMVTRGTCFTVQQNGRMRPISLFHRRSPRKNENGKH